MSVCLCKTIDCLEEFKSYSLKTHKHMFWFYDAGMISVLRLLLFFFSLYFSLKLSPLNFSIRSTVCWRIFLRALKCSCQFWSFLTLHNSNMQSAKFSLLLLKKSSLITILLKRILFRLILFILPLVESFVRVSSSNWTLFLYFISWLARSCWRFLLHVQSYGSLLVF